MVVRGLVAGSQCGGSTHHVHRRYTTTAAPSGLPKGADRLPDGRVVVPAHTIKSNAKGRRLTVRSVMNSPDAIAHQLAKVLLRIARDRPELVDELTKRRREVGRDRAA